MPAVSHSAVTTHDMSPAIQLFSSARLFFLQVRYRNSRFFGCVSELACASLNIEVRVLMFQLSPLCVVNFLSSRVVVRRSRTPCHTVDSSVAGVSCSDLFAFTHLTHAASLLTISTKILGATPTIPSELKRSLVLSENFCHERERCEVWILLLGLCLLHVLCICHP